MLKTLTKSVLGLLLFIAPFTASAAIAFDTSITSTFTNSNSKTITAYPATTNNPYVLVCVVLGSSLDVVTGVTFNTVAMTQVTKKLGGNGTFAYLYGIAAGGTHDIVVSTSQSQFIQVLVESFSGVNQSTPTEGASNNANTGTDATVGMVTTNANDWAASCGAADLAPGNFSAGTNSTLRQTDNSNFALVNGDSNGVTGIGTYTMHWTLASKAWATVGTALQPATAAVVPNPFIILLSFWGWW